MPRKKRPLNRDGGVLRDASLIVIASEDTYAVKQYFAQFRMRRVQVIVAHTEDCRSSPEHVMERLQTFKNEYATEDNDQFWLCIDTDHWSGDSHISNLIRVLSECNKAGFKVAISNPCFELWILLHFADHRDGQCLCKDITDRLENVLGSYNKQCCAKIQLTHEMVLQAMVRARALNGVEDGLPTNPSTDVYKILDEIINSGNIEFVRATSQEVK